MIHTSLKILKKIKNTNLLQRREEAGVFSRGCYAWIRTRLRGWAVAQSPILITTITLKRLEIRGYIAMLDYYTKIAHTLTSRCVRGPYVQWCVRRSPSVIAGGAVYSIGGCRSILVNIILGQDYELAKDVQSFYNYPSKETFLCLLHLSSLLGTEPYLDMYQEL